MKLSKIRTIVIILGVVALLGGIAGYRIYTKKSAVAKNPDENIDLATPVAVTEVKRGPISETLPLNGEVVPITEVNIFSTVMGKVQRIRVQEGDSVKKGAILCYIDRSEAGLVFEPTPVESTIDGIIKEVLVEIGAYITPQIPLFQVINMDYVEVVCHVPEKYIERVKIGLDGEVTVISYPERTFLGKVAKLSPVVDPLTRTREARIRLSNKDYVLKPGMFGEVRIILSRREQAVVIPLSAVVESEGRRVVFTVSDGRAVRKEPEFDVREGEKVSVISGVEPGERIIVVGQHNVTDGDAVTIAEEIQ